MSSYILDPVLGQLNFIKMSGPQIGQMSVDIDVIDRSGVDGAGTREKGLKGEPTRKTTVEWVSSLAEANASKALYQSFKGRYVTVVDDYGLVAF
ncbi:unnamed protein product, partial [marine sediment metagenome]